jgi:hypothetical protein
MYIFVINIGQAGKHILRVPHILYVLYILHVPPAYIPHILYALTESCRIVYFIYMGCLVLVSPTRGLGPAETSYSFHHHAQ